SSKDRMYDSNVRTRPGKSRATLTGARRSVADTAAAQPFPFGRRIPAFFRTVAIGSWPLLELLLHLAQSLSERHRVHPATSAESGGAVAGFPGGLREWDHVPVRRSRPQGLRPHPAPSASRGRNRR